MSVAISTVPDVIDQGIPELSVVRLTKSVRNGNRGRRMPAGSVGTIVHVYRNAAAYEVEFSQPFHAILTCERDDVSL